MKYGASTSDRPWIASRTRHAVVLGLATGTALTTVGCWLGAQAYQAHRADVLRAGFVQTGRQAAVDLTSIDHTQVDAQVERILATSTGDFHDEFQGRSRAFVDTVRSAESISVGEIAESGLESLTGNEAQVLVAVEVTSSTAAGGQQPTHGWRMRIAVRKDGDEFKVSDVQFVP